MYYDYRQQFQQLIDIGGDINATLTAVLGVLVCTGLVLIACRIFGKRR